MFYNARDVEYGCDLDKVINGAKVTETGRGTKMNSITKRQTELLYERRQLVVARALVGRHEILEGRRW